MDTVITCSVRIDEASSYGSVDDCRIRFLVSHIVDIISFLMT